MSFKGTLKCNLGWSWDEGAEDTSNLNSQETWLDGLGVNQADSIWHEDSETILDAASTTHDLTALTRTILGSTHTTSFWTIKAIMVVNESTSGGELIIGNAATSEWSEPFGADGDTVRVPLDSPLLLTSRRCGWEVDDTHKNLKLAASGGDVTYSLAIIGTSLPATGACSSSAA